MRRLVRDLRTIWWFIFGGGYENLRELARRHQSDGTDR